MVAYAEDTKGDEIYVLHVIDTESRKPVDQPIKGITCNVEWVNDEYIVYVTMDEIHREDMACTHLFFIYFVCRVRLWYYA